MEKNRFWHDEGYAPSDKSRILIFDRKQLKFLSVYFAAALLLGLIMSGLSAAAATHIIKAWAFVNQAVMVLTISNSIRVKEFRLQRQLPLHLCSVNVILTTLFAITMNERIFDFVYTYSMLGAFFALMIPDTDGGRYPRLSYRSLEYYFSHTTLIFLPLYTRMFLNVGYFKANTLYTMGMFVAFSAINYFINSKLNANYFFIMHAPNGSPVVKLEEKLGKWAYRFIYVVVMLSVCFVMHLLAR